MEEWKEYKLGDVCEVINGRAYKQEELLEEGKYRVLRVGNIFQGNNWYYSDIELPEDKYCYNGDLLYAWSCGFAPYIWKGEKTIYHYHIWKLKECKEVVDRKFLYYYLIVNTKRFLGGTHGSVMLHLTKREMEEQLLRLPSLSTQYQIASILKSLDDKIEVNRKINENLEQQAQALFKSWFVDFEPFKNGEFVESELGMIPKGWRVGTLGEITDISKLSINPQKHPQTIFEHYSIPSFDDGMTPEKQLGEDIKSNKFILKNKMTLFSKLNPRIKRVWYVDNVSTNSICSTEFVPYIAKEEKLSSFAYCLINSQGFYDFVMSMVNGATGSHQRFHPEESLKFKIPYNDSYATKYSILADPIICRILKNRDESRRLAELRDTLLPKLMSGELKVNEIVR